MALMVFFPTTFETTTSYRTHFIGFVVGIAMALIYFYLQRKKIRDHEAFRLVG
jgi:membrane associated rhomboid family serine protease